MPEPDITEVKTWSGRTIQTYPQSLFEADKHTDRELIELSIRVRDTREGLDTEVSGL